MSLESGGANPGDFDPERFRELGYHAIDLITEYYEGIAEEGVYKSPDPEALVETFDEPVPEAGQDPEAVLAE